MPIDNLVKGMMMMLVFEMISKDALICFDRVRTYLKRGTLIVMRMVEMDIRNGLAEVCQGED